MGTISRFLRESGMFERARFPDQYGTFRFDLLLKGDKRPGASIRVFRYERRIAIHPVAFAYFPNGQEVGKYVRESANYQGYILDAHHVWGVVELIRKGLTPTELASAEILARFHRDNPPEKRPAQREAMPERLGRDACAQRTSKQDD